jgi:serralysin
MQKQSDTAIMAPAGGGGLVLALGDPIGDSIATAIPLALGSDTTTLIEAAGDLDYYRVSLTAGQTYRFAMTGVSPGPVSDPFLEVRDSAGVLIQTDDDGGPGINATLVFTAPTSGDYYLVARGFSTEVGRYTLEADAVPMGNSSPTLFPDNGLPMFSWDQAALQITREGATWNNDVQGAPVVVTYAFRSTAPARMPSDTAGFERFSAVQIDAAEAALQALAQVSNIQFVRVGSGASGDGAYSNNAAILFGNYNSGEAGAAAFAYLPQSGDQSATNSDGDVWVNITLPENINPVVGSYGAQTLLHEIGHAIGLSHPSRYNAAEGVTITYEQNAQYFNDSRVFTVMTYFGSPPVGGNLPIFASTPQLHDIAAVQYLYGVNTTTRTGDTVYGFNSTAGRPDFAISSATQGAAFSIWDAGGIDTLDLSGYTQAATIDLREEAFSSAGPGSNAGDAHFNISIARGVSIENAVGGAGNDTLIGNLLDNILSGGDGIDTIFGGAGQDRLLGNAGDDTLIGEGGDDFLQGVGGFDWMVGGDGNDTFAGGEPGTNVMIGGAGVDIASYGAFVFSVWVDLSANVYSSPGVWDAFQEIEGLAGGAGDDILFGNAGANSLFGNAGADVLIGRVGNDILVGGLGDDWLDGGDGDDALEGGVGTNVLLGGAGVDLASYASNAAAVWFNLAAGAYSALGVWDAFVSIEGALGSAFGDTLFGDAAANTLNGDAGDDSLIGLEGDDTLIGGAGSDWIVGGGGADRLIGGAGVDVLTGGAGADQFDLGVAAGWDVALDFNPSEDRFSLGGLDWLGFVTIDADGVGGANDTLLGYAGGNFVAIGVAGLTLEQWNALVVDAASSPHHAEALFSVIGGEPDYGSPVPERAPLQPSPDFDTARDALVPPWNSHAISEHWGLLLT